MVNPALESVKQYILNLAEDRLIHVLHVDNDSDFLKTAKKILEMHGPFKVDMAYSVEEALDKMKKKTYDAIISDYVMPRKDGLQFLKELREKGDKIPFIIFTGKSREEVAISALNLGANQYISKVGDSETVFSELAHGVLEAEESRKTEEELRNSIERLDILFQYAPDAYYLSDLKGNLIDGNKAAERLIGFNKCELVGKSFLKLKILSRSQILKAAKLLALNAIGRPTGPTNSH